MSTTPIDIPFEKLPKYYQRFYRFWAKKARITIEDLMNVLMQDAYLRGKPESEIGPGDRTELDRVMSLKPAIRDFKPSMFEKICIWFYQRFRRKRPVIPRSRK